MSGQRVNIQYSIDLEELPSEVERLIENSSEYLEDSLSVVEELLEQDDHLTIKTVNEINTLRLALSKVDYVLDDVSKIVGGYLKMTVAPPQETEEQQSAPVGNPFIDQRYSESTINELQQKLSDFQERVNNEEPTEVSVD